MAIFSKYFIIAFIIILNVLSVCGKKKRRSSKANIRNPRKVNVFVNNNIKMLTPEDFENHGKERPLFIFFGSGGSVNSESFTSTWIEFQNKANEEKLTDKINIGKIECNKYPVFCQEQNINHFPTLILYYKNEKLDELVEYKTSEDIVNFVRGYYDKFKIISHEQPKSSSVNQSNRQLSDQEMKELKKQFYRKKMNILKDEKSNKILKDVFRHVEKKQESESLFEKLFKKNSNKEKHNIYDVDDNEELYNDISDDFDKNYDNDMYDMFKNMNKDENNSERRKSSIPNKSEIPVEKQSADNEPTEQQPVGNSSLDEPIEEQPVDNKPVDNKPVEEQPVDNKPVDEQPVHKKPVEEQPVHKKPVEKLPVIKKPTNNKPNENQPTNDKPEEKQPIESQPVSAKSFNATSDIDTSIEDNNIDDYNVQTNNTMSNIEENGEEYVEEYVEGNIEGNVEENVGENAEIKTYNNTSDAMTDEGVDQGNIDYNTTLSTVEDEAAENVEVLNNEEVVENYETVNETAENVEENLDDNVNEDYQKVKLVVSDEETSNKESNPRNDNNYYENGNITDDEESERTYQKQNYLRVNQKQVQKTGFVRKILSLFRSLKSLFVLFVILSGLYALIRYTNIFKFKNKSRYSSYDYNSYVSSTKHSSNDYGYIMNNNNTSDVNKYFSNGPGLVNRKFVNYNHIPVRNSTSFASASTNNSSYSMPTSQSVPILNYNVGMNKTNNNNNNKSININNNTNNNNNYYQSQIYTPPKVNYYNNNNNNNNTNNNKSQQSYLPVTNQANNTQGMNSQANYSRPGYSMNYSISTNNDQNKKSTNGNTMSSQGIKKSDSTSYNSSISISDAFIPNFNNNPPSNLFNKQNIQS